MSNLTRESESEEAFVTSIRRGLNRIELLRFLRRAAELLLVTAVVAVIGNAAFLRMREVVGVLGPSWDEGIALEVGLVASIAIALTVSAVAREALTQIAEHEPPRR